MSAYKDQLRKKLSQMDINCSRVLAIGIQEDDRKYFKSIECDKWVTLDTDENFKPNILWDLNRPIEDGLLHIPEEYIEGFDCVVALNIWEYMFDPVSALRNIFDLMAPGAILITNFPFVYPVHRPEGTDYLRFTPEGVEKLMQTMGLTVDRHDYIYGNQLLEDYYRVDGLKARGGFDHRIIGSIIIAKK